MRILLSVLPRFQDPFSNSFSAHLGNACISAYLKQNDKTLKVNTIDLRGCPEVSKIWAFNLPFYSYKNLFVGDIQELPIIVSLIKNFRENKSVMNLIKTDNELIRRWSIERSIFPDRIIENNKQMNFFALKYLKLFEGYDIVGFSLYNTNIYLSVLMALLIRINFPKTKIVFGGPQITQGETTRELLLKSDIADFVVLGEGEQPMLEAIKAIKSGESLNNIVGIKTIENLNSLDTFSKNANLETLPLPDFEDIYYNKMIPMQTYFIPVYSNRGCPFRCHFCSEHSLFGKKFKSRSPERVFQDMKELSGKYRISNFSFMDSLLNSSENWLEEFSDILINSKENFRWGGYFRAELDEKLTKKMIRAGLSIANLGVESFSQETLNSMNKKKVNSKIIDSIHFLIENKIITSINLFVAYPEETEENFLFTMDSTKALYEKYSNKNMQPFFDTTVRTFQLRPFSSIFNNYQKFGIEVDSWSDHYSEEYYPEDLKNIFEKTFCTFKIKDISVSEVLHREYMLNQVREIYIRKNLK